jgi:probable phosphoglycerate mutase
VAEKIIVVRHCETEWSATGRHTSHTDLPLNEDGRRRAAAIAGELAGERFEVVLTSPLRRARETCELAGFGSAAVAFDDLREWDYGEYEGRTTPEIRAERPDWVLWRDGCPGGELPDRVSGRADRVLARLEEVEGAALLFAHGHIIRVLAARWIELTAATGARLMLDAGAIGVLGHERETRAIARWNARSIR